MTREKLGSVSDIGSPLRVFDPSGLPSSARLEIEPLIGDILPCFPDETDETSSGFISTSRSFLVSDFSSVSIGSPSAAAFLFSLALTLAVVNKTAVATLVMVSFLGGLVADGYVDRLGFVLEIKSNLGA